MRAIGETLLGIILTPLVLLWAITISFLPLGVAVFFILVFLDWINVIRVF